MKIVSGAALYLVITISAVTVTGSDTPRNDSAYWVLGSNVADDLSPKQCEPQIAQYIPKVINVGESTEFFCERGRKSNRPFLKTCGNSTLWGTKILEGPNSILCSTSFIGFLAAVSILSVITVMTFVLFALRIIEIFLVKPLITVLRWVQSIWIEDL